MAAGMAEVTRGKSGAEASLNKAGAAGTAALGNTSKAARLTSMSLKDIGSKAGAFAHSMKYASGIAGIALYASAKAASDLQETISFTQVTFNPGCLMPFSSVG